MAGLSPLAAEIPPRQTSVSGYDHPILRQTPAGGNVMSLSTHALGRPEITLRSLDGTLVDVYTDHGEVILATPGGKLHFSEKETEELAKVVGETQPADESADNEAYDLGEEDGRERGRQDVESELMDLAEGVMEQFTFQADHEDATVAASAVEVLRIFVSRTARGEFDRLADLTREAHIARGAAA